MTSNERRFRSDRRHRENDPPSRAQERRCLAERRLPDVVERSLSYAEWRAYFGTRDRGRRNAVDVHQKSGDIVNRLWGDL